MTDLACVRLYLRGSPGQYAPQGVEKVHFASAGMIMNPVTGVIIVLSA